MITLHQNYMKENNNNRSIYAIIRPWERKKRVTTYDGPRKQQKKTEHHPISLVTNTL